MPQIGVLHPQVVHFVIASLFIGLPIYWLSFVPRLKPLRIMAMVLLVIGVGAAWVAVESGDQAHGPVEAIPGARPAVEEHEQLGERTAIVFSVLIALQALALLAERTSAGQVRRAAEAPEPTEAAPYDPDALAPGTAMRTAATSLTLLVAFGWAGGLGILYEAAEHGGEIVYAHAGGVGTRSGDPEDVQRLLIAGLYQESILDREAGQYEDAARLVDEMVRRYPEDAEIRMLLAESMIEDRQDPRGALRALASLQTQGGGRTALRQALLRSDAYKALQLPDSARLVLEALPEAQRRNRGVVQRLDALTTP